MKAKAHKIVVSDLKDAVKNTPRKTKTIREQLRECGDKFPFLFRHRHGGVTVWADDVRSAMTKATIVGRGLVMVPQFTVPPEVAADFE